MLKFIKYKIPITVILTILVIILLFLSNSTFFNLLSGEKNIPDNGEKDELEVDDRISPLTNQGLILEIKRIRHRGLLDTIMKIGTSWKKKPIFYVETDIDGLKYSRHEEFGFTFNIWDSIFQEFRIIRDADEEQETSEVKFTIIDQEAKGILGQRYSDMGKETIHVTYDYRTGRWNGEDDFFKDKDGYGHYVGDTFEAWFNIYQTDFDHDGIPFWTEVNILNSNPRVDDSNQDPDCDGIPTAWEWKWGYDPNVWDDHKNLDPDIDGIQNIEEYKIEKWFADPFSPDIYIEVDEMERGGLFDPEHVLFDESQQIVIERFCRHGINVYIDDGWPGGLLNGGGELLPHVKTISCDSGMMQSFYDNHFADERKGIFRYLLMCHNGGAFIAYSGNTMYNNFDTIVIGTTLCQRLLTPRVQRLLMASAVLHELGHTLSIAPYIIEGCDNDSFLNKFILGKNMQKYMEEWGNYKSVMNYIYIFNIKIVDYSDGSHGYNDQNDWERFYLPFFEIECNIVCEPVTMPPATEKVVDENLSIVLDGWEYNEESTQRYIENISDWSPIDPIKCSWNVYVKTDEDLFPSNRNIRVYARPQVPISQWSLIMEGEISSNGEMIFR